MRDSEKLAVAARIHVMLRRKTGRVTDTEWMARDAAYAREIVRFSREYAGQENDAELAEWAGKLEAAVLGNGVGSGPAISSAAPESGQPEAAGSEAPKSRYVWGIR